MPHPSPRPLLIHVGYHKTATSWLQNEVFLPRFHFWPVMTHREVFDTILDPHGLDFDPAAAQAIIAERQALAPPETAVDVISLESLTGLPFAGGRESDDFARRLAAIAPGARILFTIREQVAIIASVYMQYVFRAGTAAPARFFDETGFDGYPHFEARNFEYDRLVALYQDLFGAGNVLVLPQETIARDQGAAVALLAEFSGNRPLAEADWTPITERGTSFPQYAVPLFRRVNYLRREAMNPNPALDLGRLGHLAYRGAGWLARHAPLPRRITGSRPVTEAARTQFAGRFADSNRRLAGLLAHPVDLSRYEGLGDPASAPRPARMAAGG